MTGAEVVGKTVARSQGFQPGKLRKIGGCEESSGRRGLLER